MELDRASRELYKRQPDERFASLETLSQFCRAKQEQGIDRWVSPSELGVVGNGSLTVQLEQKRFVLNEWSFSQLCRLAKVSKDTVNRVRTKTAQQIFAETLPRDGNKPFQVLTDGQHARSVHGAAYTRLWDNDLVDVVKETAIDFEPPQKGSNGATGLYAGEQDLFMFLIDPAGWTEIGDQAFAPGFFVWNSEVGRRSLGIETFWFQAICANHIVWDATEVFSFKRKHTANVAEGLTDIRRILTELVAKRDERKDSFYKVIKQAMAESVTSDDALKLILKQGITRKLAQQAIVAAQQSGRFTIFSIVDALTRMSRDLNAGDRVELDSKSSSLLTLATSSLSLGV